MGFKRSETFISNIFHVFHTIPQLKLSVTSEIFCICSVLRQLINTGQGNR